jgi:hypothetical protein
MVVLIIIGLITKSNYKDFNEKENAVDDFVVGVLPDQAVQVMPKGDQNRNGHDGDAHQLAGWNDKGKQKAYDVL